MTRAGAEASETEQAERWARQWGERFAQAPWERWAQIARAAAFASPARVRRACGWAWAGETAFARERFGSIEQCARRLGMDEAQALALRGPWALWLWSAPREPELGALGLGWASLLSMESEAPSPFEGSALLGAWTERASLEALWGAKDAPESREDPPEGEGERLAASLLLAVCERASGRPMEAEERDLAPTAASVLEHAANDWLALRGGVLADLRQALALWRRAGGAIERGAPVSALRACADLGVWDGAESDFEAKNGSWRAEKRDLALWLAENGADCETSGADGLSPLTEWCDADGCARWDAHWPAVVAEIARRADPSAPDGAGWAPIARAAGAALHFPAARWSGRDGAGALGIGLRIAQALIDAGASPSPRLPGGGRLASRKGLDPRWAAFLDAQLQARALGGAANGAKKKGGARDGKGEGDEREGGRGARRL
jgi:hypothetical protein